MMDVSIKKLGLWTLVSMTWILFPVNILGAEEKQDSVKVVTVKWDEIKEAFEGVKEFGPDYILQHAQDPVNKITAEDIVGPAIALLLPLFNGDREKVIETLKKDPPHLVVDFSENEDESVGIKVLFPSGVDGFNKDKFPWPIIGVGIYIDGLGDITMDVGVEYRTSDSEWKEDRLELVNWILDRGGMSEEYLKIVNIIKKEVISKHPEYEIRITEGEFLYLDLVPM